MASLGKLGVAVAINPVSVEMPEAVHMDRDARACRYDADWARRFFGALVRIDAVLKRFRGGFLGKASPVHFFWGGFDLAVTRFSGRTAPPHPGGIPNVADAVMREAYSHEVSSAGFWPGDARFPEAAFYAYAYPEPAGFRDAAGAPGRGALRQGAGRVRVAVRGGARGAAIRRPTCWRSWRPRTPPPPTSGAGIGARWNGRRRPAG